MHEQDKLAMDRVRKARAELILSRRFYGVLVSNVEPVISREVGAAATDTKRHYFNPDFVATLSQEELLGTQVHESEHDARHHSTRRMGRDPKDWNAACDLAIDQDIIAEGFKLPAVHLDWLRDNWNEAYRGLSAEDIYRAREQQKQQEQPEGDGGDEADETEGEQTESESEPGQDGEAEDESQGDDGQDGDEEGQDEAEGNGEGQGGGEETDDQGEPKGQGEGNGEEAEAAEGQGGQGEGDGEAEAQAEGQGGDANGEGNEVGNGKAPKSSGDPGRCGEVLDAAEDTAGLSDEDAKWERIVRQAASLAKAAGQLPGHITREIERANNPTQDWREVLRAWIDGGARRIETWNRPNRRFVGRGFVLPGSQRDGVNKVCFLIDTSGSMDSVALECVRTEAQAALDDGAIDEVVVIYGDTRVTRVDTFHDTDEIEFDPRGGGGTDLRPLFQYVADEHFDASLIICFTDLYIGDPGPEPHCPVLFAVTGILAPAVQALIDNAPWGAPGIDVGAH
jgi:predicted metal-dependent peptidase